MRSFIRYLSWEFLWIDIVGYCLFILKWGMPNLGRRFLVWIPSPQYKFGLTACCFIWNCKTRRKHTSSGIFLTGVTWQDRVSQQMYEWGIITCLHWHCKELMDGLCLLYTLFLYKNQLYKNKEAQNDPKFKNKLRTAPASKFVNILRTSSPMS